MLTPKTATEELAQRIQHANRVVFLTGAGVSTPSGIPDFRGAHSQNRLLINLSAQDFKCNPLEAYRSLWPFVRQALDAKPNLVHIYSVQLLKKRVIEAIITQNVDSLFTLAGASKAWELHGNVYRGVCGKCKQPFDMRAIWQDFGASEFIPHSPCCNTYIRPDVVLFGEKIPASVWEHAHRLSRASDLMVVIGSSLEVAPAGFLPELSREIVIINRGPTALDHRASLKIEEDVMTVFEQLSKAIGTI